MSLAVRPTVSNGVSRVATLTGVVLALAFAGLQFVLLAVSDGSGFVTVSIEVPRGTGLQLPVSAGVASAIAALGSLLGIVLVVAICRAMVRDADELAAFPGEIVTRRIARATLSSILATILITIAVWLGLLLAAGPILVVTLLLAVGLAAVGGSVGTVVAVLLGALGVTVSIVVGTVAALFVLTSFVFVFPCIAIEDLGVTDAMKRSWELASGYRSDVFSLLLGAFAIHLVAGIVGLAFAWGVGIAVVFPGGEQAVADVVSAFLSGVLLVLYLGVVADAYLQLRDDSPPAIIANSSDEERETIT